MTRRLEVLLLAAVLLFCIACATGAMPAPARAGDKDVKLVDVLWFSPRADQWRASGWYRAFTDMATPSRVVISADQYACVMGDMEVVDPDPGSYYHCQTAWRPQSHSIFRP
jgi:hypothetical protein